jgi:hypothetical protein
MFYSKTTTVENTPNLILSEKISIFKPPLIYLLKKISKWILNNHKSFINIGTKIFL